MMAHVPVCRHKISIAPMMGWTDRHARYFLRQISKQVLLYTEMVTTGALIRGDRDYHLAYNPVEHPLALQLGGNEPRVLAECALIAEDYGYDEVNLNIGCPSDRVQAGRFGACLMLEPDLVAECIHVMQHTVSIPVSIKCRIGVDEQEDYESLAKFIEKLSRAGCRQFIIHARNAWLKGLSPKQNRDIPPLKYHYVYQIKQDFPDLFIGLNGGVKTLDAAAAHLLHIDSVMIGREAYHNPYILADVDSRFYGDTAAAPTRHQILEKMLPYVRQQLAEQLPLNTISRHMLGLFSGCRGARAWRCIISNQKLTYADESLLLKAAAAIEEA